MQLKLAIIHMGMVVETLELEPGEYSLGRGSHNNIVVQHFSLEPEHGRIFFKDERWFYGNVEGTQQSALTSQSLISLTPQISLSTQEYVESAESEIRSFTVEHGRQQSKIKQRMVVAAASVVLLLSLVSIGYLAVRSRPDNVQQSQLINTVRDKIVEFESNRDDQAIDQIKKYAGLSDADFKETSGFCTGFLVGPNIVLTAAHCLFGTMVIDINNDFYLKTSDGKSHQIKRVLGFDVKRDFLFLETEGMESYGYLDFADGYDIEQKVYTVGNVHGEGIAIRDGIVSSETADADEPDVKFLRYSAGTSPGNSGGPLVNSDGEVVALVFASTSTENFNLGTPTQYLQQAYETYVEGVDEPKTIEVSMKRVLNFKPALMVSSLSLPYLPQFDEYPEISREFNDVQFEVQVPMDFATVDEAVLEPLNSKVIETFFKVQNFLKQKNEPVLDWKSFVSKKTPAILPSQFDISQSVFTKIGDRYYPQVAGLIDSPSKSDFVRYKKQLKKEDKFDFQAYGYNIEIQTDKVDLLPSDVFYKNKNETGNKERLLNLASGAPYSQMIVFGREDLRRDNFFGLKLFIKNFIGKEGMITSTLSRFIRPASIKDFTVREIEVGKEDVRSSLVKDKLGRSWRREVLKIFEFAHIITYCRERPEGTFCIARAFNIQNDFLLKVIENNFRKFVLSHLLINPYFWEPEALIPFMASGKAKTEPLMRGINLTMENGTLKGSLEHFPFRFEVPQSSKVESVRPLTGLYFNSKSEKHWTGYGLEWVSRQEDKDLVCGLGVEVFESQSAFILNFLRDRKKQEKLKKIKGEPAKALPGVWYKPFRGLKDPFQIYGYCAPLEEDPRVSNQYFVDFKNAKPLKYNHSISN